jgi:CheY-like chemotaxis protein
MNILVVDDEEAIVEELGRFLQRRGHAVVPAGSVRAALDALQRQAFDLVLTDLRMPDGTGLDVVRACRALPAPRPMPMVMSGHADGAEVARAFDAGALQVFGKPIPLRALLQILADIEISHYRAAAEHACESPGTTP